MAASVRQEALESTPPFQGNNSLMFTDVGGGDKREGQFMREGRTAHHVAHAEVEGLGWREQQRHTRGWQMADDRWQMADGRWWMADGRWQDNLP
jgi:hypothetical protein